MIILNPDRDHFKHFFLEFWNCTNGNTALQGVDSAGDNLPAHTTMPGDLSAVQVGIVVYAVEKSFPCLRSVTAIAGQHFWQGKGIGVAYYRRGNFNNFFVSFPEWSEHNS